jgi:hypothetical protein
MRLFNCVLCHDILLVTNDWRRCVCGKSASRYLKDTTAIEITGTAKIIDVDDNGYGCLIQNSKAKWDCKFLFVDGLRIQRTKLPID